MRFTAYRMLAARVAGLFVIALVLFPACSGSKRDLDRDTAKRLLESGLDKAFTNVRITGISGTEGEKKVEYVCCLTDEMIRDASDGTAPEVTEKLMKSLGIQKLDDDIKRNATFKRYDDGWRVVKD